MKANCISHHHNHKHCISNKKDIKQISKALLIILLFMLTELWGHYKTNSLSLLADALHLLVDISGFLISIFTLAMSKKKPTKTMTWGYQRVEVIGAMASVILIWIALIYLVMESIHRYIYPSEIEGRTFLWIAILGLFFNLGCVYILHESSSETPRNLNIRAAYVHVIGDVVQSIGVIIASLIVYLNPKLVIADIGCTLFFACLVFISTYYIVKDCMIILAEGSPREINQYQIHEFILNEESVIKVIDMNVWSLGVRDYAIIIKVLVDHIMINEYEDLLIRIKDHLKDIIDENRITVQIETLHTYKDSGSLVINGLLIN